MRSDLLRLTSQCFSASEFEGAVLSLLQQAVGFEVGFFSMKGTVESPCVIGIDAKVVERAVLDGTRYDRELLPVKRAALQAHGVAVDTRVLGEQGVRKTAYYRELARPLGGKHSLMAYARLRGRVIGALMLGRSGSSFADRELASVEALLPELAVARASYGLPWSVEPLAVPRASKWQERLVGAPRTRTLAIEQVGETTVEVRDRDGYREMVARANGAELVWTRAGIRDPSESGWPYIELFHLAALTATARTRALFIGCGGAVALRQFARSYAGLAIDVVERDAQVIELARAWYDLEKIPGLRVHIADGRAFVERAPPSAWDIVVLDAFDASDVTAAMSHPSFFEAVHRSLRAGGALAVNVIGTLDGRGPVRDVGAALMRSFERVRVVPVMHAGESDWSRAPRNVVLVASRRSR
jgi:spermidine synthase